MSQSHALKTVSGEYRILAGGILYNFVTARKKMAASAKEEQNAWPGSAPYDRA
jgi:hypothetical protein